MQVLLVNSYCKFKFIPPLYPIALAYIGSSILRKTEDRVSAIDLNLYDNPLDKLKEVLKQRVPDIVGVSMRDMPWYPSLLSASISHISKLCKVIKAYNSNIKLIIGGACFSLFSEDLMELIPDIDIGIVGEGEDAFIEVIKNIDNLKRVKGIYYREKGKLEYTGNRSLMNVDNIPMLEDIPGLDPLRYKYVGVQTRRGCAFECIYCPNEFLQGDLIRQRSINRVIEEIKFYKNRGVNSFYFADTIFNIPRDFAMGLVKEMIRNKLNIKWGAQFKPIDLDYNFLEDIENSGCNLIDLTADCGSDKILESLRAGVTVNSILETAELISKFKNITQSWYSITNLPAETVQTNFARIKLILRLIKTGVKPTNIFINRLKYCPHTELNDIYPGIRRIDISKPSFCYWYLLLDKDIYMTCLIGLFAIYRALKGFKRYAY